MFGSIVPSKQTLSLILIVSAGVTLVGASTYFFAHRYQKKRSKRVIIEDEVDYMSDDDLKEMYDQIYSNRDL